MELPFTIQQFYDVFRKYNETVWPAQIPITGLALAALIVFALVLYPAWSWYAGHRFPAMPTFGLPCPTTIFTIGLLCFLIPPYPRASLIAPIVWCFIGAQAAILLGVPQDLGLVLAAGVGLMLLVRAKPRLTLHGVG